MSLALVFVSSIALSLGTSPLVDETHDHEWELILDDEKGMAWIDTAWRSSVRTEAGELPLLLMRSDLAHEEGPIRADVVLAADCEKSLLGISAAYIFGLGAHEDMERHAETIDMTFADNPPSPDDLLVIAAACTRGSTQ